MDPLMEKVLRTDQQLEQIFAMLTSTEEAFVKFSTDMIALEQAAGPDNTVDYLFEHLDEYKALACVIAALGIASAWSRIGTAAVTYKESARED